MQYAIETLQIELFKIKGLLRTKAANERSIMQNIPCDNELKNEAELQQAISHLQGCGTHAAANNTGSPKLPCQECLVPDPVNPLWNKFWKYCPWCGRQLLAGA